jgi:hypothetical protein
MIQVSLGALETLFAGCDASAVACGPLLYPEGRPCWITWFVRDWVRLAYDCNSSVLRWSKKSVTCSVLK